MKKNILGLFFFILISFFITILIFDYRYPFFTSVIGNWSVGFQETENIFPEADLSSSRIISYDYINSLLPESIDYIADPFFIKENDIYYLFVELKGEGNANIALLTSKDGENYEYQGIVLDESFHLSYPQVFKYRDEYYMLPETAGANNVLLYKAENFPYEWKIFDTIIKNKKLKDPSLLLSEDLNLIVAVDDDLKQYMFVSDSLRGTWTEAGNYKQRWGNETRPGGRFIKVNENWYLPLQNRSKGYGTGVSLFKLIKSNGTLQLKKTFPFYLGPQKDIEWFNRGMHHLDVQHLENGYYMVYDGDRNLNNQKEFQYKRTFKFNLVDIYNYFRD